MALDRLIRGFALKHLSIAVVACALPVTLGAQTTTVSLRDAVFIATGSELFAKNCAVGYCHGSEGRAGRGPRLRDKVWNADKLFGVVHDGIPNTTMPPWKDILPEREIWSIVAYVISIGAVDSDAAAGKVQLSASGSSDLLTDEARKGRELFFDLMNEKRSAPTKGEAGHGSRKARRSDQARYSRPASRVRGRLRASRYRNEKGRTDRWFGERKNSGVRAAL